MASPGLEDSDSSSQSSVVSGDSGTSRRSYSSVASSNLHRPKPPSNSANIPSTSTAPSAPLTSPSTSNHPHSSSSPRLPSLPLLSLEEAGVGCRSVAVARRLGRQWAQWSWPRGDAVGAGRGPPTPQAPLPRPLHRLRRLRGPPQRLPGPPARRPPLRPRPRPPRPPGPPHRLAQVRQVLAGPFLPSPIPLSRFVAHGQFGDSPQSTSPCHSQNHTRIPFMLIFRPSPSSSN